MLERKHGRSQRQVGMEASDRTFTRAASETSMPLPLYRNLLSVQVSFHFILFQIKVSDGCVWLSEFKLQALKGWGISFWFLAGSRCHRAEIPKHTNTVQSMADVSRLQDVWRLRKKENVKVTLSVQPERQGGLW